MEEHSNGKIEETQKEESQGNGVEVVKELFEELKSEVLRVEEAVLDGNSEAVGEGEEEEEKEVIMDSVSDPVEVVSSEKEIPLEDDHDSGDTNVVVEQEVEETKEKVIELEPEDVVEKEETNGVSEAVETVVSEGIQEIALPSQTTEVTAPNNESTGETSEVAAADKEEPEEKKDGSLEQPPTEVPAVVDNEDDTENVNKAEITETARTSPIISISNRTVQPTSWRSCCGLFEVLRRNR